MARNKMFRTVYNTAKAHVRGTINNVSESATNNAKELHDIDLDILKPNLAKVVTDLKEWNSTRKEDAKLSRDELKEIALGVLSEAKRVIKDPESKIDNDDEDMEAFFAEMEAGLDDMDFGVENDMSTDSIPEEVIEGIEVPDNATISSVAISLLFSVNDDKFRNYLAHHIDSIKASLGIVEYNTDTNAEEIAVVNELCDDCVHEVIQDGTINDSTVLPEEVIEEIVEEVEASSATSNLDLVMNQPELDEKTGLESENILYNNFENDITAKVISLLRCYQRNENFTMVVDRVMLCLYKVVNEYESTEVVDKIGLQILSKYELIRLIIATLGTNILDTVSLYTLATLYLDEENPVTKVLNDLTLSVVDTLNKGGNHSQI